MRGSDPTVRSRRFALPILVVCLVALALAAARAQRGAATGGVIWPPFQPFGLQEIPPGIGRVTGRVLDRDLRTPVPNVSVTIRLLPASPAAQPRNAGITLLTNDRGEFTLRDVAFGRYTLQAAALGYTRRLRLSSLVPNEIVTLTASQPDASVNFSMSKTGVMTGRVLDESGAPAGGVPVRVLRHVMVSPRLIWQPIPVMAITDPAGVFRFTNAPAGDYVVGVYYRALTVPASVSTRLWNPPGSPDAQALSARLAESNATVFQTSLPAGTIDVDGFRFSVFDALNRPLLARATTLDEAFYRSVYSGGSAGLVTAAAPISLDAGEVRSGVDLTLRKTRGVRVSGVLTGDPAQIAHVSLRLMPADEYDLWETFPQEQGATVSDAQGRFTFLGVPQGPVSIVSVINVLTSPPGAPPRRATAAWVREKLEVGDRDIEGLKVAVNPTVLLRGRIVMESSNPGPPDAWPPPMNLRLMRSSSASQPPVVNPGNAPGEFLFTQLVGGRYMFEVLPWNGRGVRSIAVGGRETLNRSFEVTARDINDVVVTMIESSARLTGAVVGDGGVPADGAQVVLFPDNHREWIAAGRVPGLLRTSMTSNGRYLLTGLQSGAYRLLAFASPVENDWQTAKALDALAPAAQLVHVGRQPLNVDVRVVLPGIPRK
jgi:hypothetical protein